MRTDIYKNRPAPSTPYERMRWQQQHCTEDLTGYAVGFAAEVTERAAYLTAEGTLTNDENKAVVLPKQEATALMTNLYESGKGIDKHLWKIAFLVPVSKEYQLYGCTFQGH